jgi:2,4-dienoyl-CoA reductase-like NADH-dependent reductase (Old Yellow Enzyme family)
MTSLFAPLSFTHGPDMKNRFMLAPLTNSQSHDDGVLSDDEFHWLTLRAKGGFGLTMTCAAHVQAEGQGFAGQLGIFADKHQPGLTRLANAIKAQGSVAIVQLHHAGMRSPADLIGTTPLCPSDNDETGARAMTVGEVEAMIEAFITAAERAEQAGFQGIEIHGAHGYILSQFLSAEINQRQDQYGGSLMNRARPIFDIIDGIRARCGQDFMIGLRLSPERFGLVLDEVLEVCRRILLEAKIDFLDMSLWDVFKEPSEEKHKGKTLMSCFTELERGDVRLGVAGKIVTPADAERAMAAGVDWVMLGRAAILHHDYPEQLRKDSDFIPVSLPVSAAYLGSQGLSDNFVKYMSSWKGFVEE